MNTKRVLLIEDEHNLARTLAQALRIGSDGKFMVDICETGEHAIELLSKNFYDVVISDFRLPDTTGLNIIAHVSETQPNTATILITAYGSEEVKQKASDLADGYLSKPFNLLDLLVLVHRVVKPESKKSLKDKIDTKTEDDQDLRILIMEDDPGLQRIYSKALARTNYIMDQAHSLNEARDYLTSQAYKIFICDIHLGRERGTDILTEYKDILDKNQTQVIMVSAYGAYRSLTEEMGADFFLEKPISLGTLLTLINRLMNRDSIPL